MPPSRAWRAADDTQLLALWRATGGDVAAVARALDRGTRAVVGRKCALRKAGRWPADADFAYQRTSPAPLAMAGADLSRTVTTHTPHGPTLCEVLAPTQTSEESDDDFLARVLGQTDAAVAKANALSFAKLRIVTDKPIALSVSSDWHLTPRGASQVRALFEYAKACAAADGVYALGVGDLTDAPVKHKPTAVRDLPEEWRLLDLLVEAFGGKLVATTDGNHDAWIRQAVGLDHLKIMAERHQLHYAPDELVYVVEIESPTTGEVTARWVIATRHKYRRHSALNVTHSCWRWLEEMVNEWPRDGEYRTLLPDALCIGDSHVAGVEERSYPRGSVWGIRMGPWQHSTSFSRGLGFPRYEPTAPVIVLGTTREQGIQAFADYRRGLDYLARVRGDAEAGDSPP